jgi:hypothetical protein
MKLYNDEIHIIAPTEIRTVFDLEGKRIEAPKDVGSRNSWMHCFPGLTNSPNRRVTPNGRRRALPRSYLGGSGLKPRKTGSTVGMNKTTRLERGRLPNSRTLWPMRGAQICPRKSWKNYSRSSSSGNDAPRTSLGCGRGGGCGRSTACRADEFFVQSKEMCSPV